MRETGHHDKKIDIKLYGFYCTLRKATSARRELREVGKKIANGSSAQHMHQQDP